MNRSLRVLSLGCLLLLQACVSKGPAQPVDHDVFLFGSYPVYVQQQICNTTRSGTATAANPVPVPLSAVVPAATSTVQGERHNGHSGQGTLTADQERLRLSVQDQRYGCYADRRRSRANQRRIYLAPYGSVTAAAQVTAVDFKAAANLAAMRNAQRARAQLDAGAMGLGSSIGLSTGGLLR